MSGGRPARPVEANPDRVGVSLETFKLGETNNILPIPSEGSLGIGDDARLLDEVIDTQGRGEPGGSGGREDVVRPGEVVAYRLRRVVAEEHRPGVLDLTEEFIGLGHQELEVFRCDSVRQVDGCLQVGSHDHCTEAGQGLLGNLPPREPYDLLGQSDGGCHGECGSAHAGSRSR